jgi:hypothetical protein
MGSKTLSYEGELKGLLEKQGFKYTKKKTENEGIFTFTFKNNYGITFKYNGLISDFAHLAKQAIQMELVRMGDKSQLYVNCGWRPTVTVNS